MFDSNHLLWKEERFSRRRLWSRSAFLISLAFIFIFPLCLWLTQPLFTNVEPKAVSNGADAASLRQNVHVLATDLYPRDHLHSQNLDRTADHIRSEFEKSGSSVSEQAFQVNGVNYRNVSLLLGSKSGDRIVIGAHYDSAFDTPGADDNASGIAGLIELSRLLAKSDLASPVELVAYTLEEPPFFGTDQMGSFVHANSLHADGIGVRLMISLEMIGYFTDEPGSQKFPIILGQVLYPTTGNFAAIVGNFTNTGSVRKFKRSLISAGIETRSLSTPEFLPGVSFSDHRNYWKFGYNAIMITDTAYFRNQAYHTVGDTEDRLDYDRMAEVVNGVFNGVVEIANE